MHQWIVATFVTPLAFAAFVTAGWLLPPADCCFLIYNFSICCAVIVCCFCYHHLIVELLFLWVALTIFVTTNGLLLHLSPPFTFAFFVATGWLAPPVDCCFLN